jgi:hypothetical protein
MFVFKQPIKKTSLRDFYLFLSSKNMRIDTNIVKNSEKGNRTSKTSIKKCVQYT